jgi:hypothetical protein
MAPSVSSKTQFTRAERTWRISYRACDRVIGPFIVCIEVMSSSGAILGSLLALLADALLELDDLATLRGVVATVGVHRP